jgi:DeoR family fructose operon transcriptional repressor
VDKAFLATNGLSAKKGLTTPDMNVAEVKKTLRSIANEVFLLADSSKLGYDAFVQVATLDQIDSLITDSGADADELSQLRDAGLQIQIAEDI